MINGCWHSTGLHIAEYLGIQLTNIERFLQQNGRNFVQYQPNAARGRRIAPANTSQQNTSTQPWMLQAPMRLDWDAQADTFAMAAHRAGKTMPDVLRQLITNGYKATKASLTASLQRQGVQNVNWDDVPDTQFRSWDAQADAFAIAAHTTGQTAAQISSQLIRNGYNPTKAEVVANLHGLGAQNVSWGVVAVPKFRWDAQADTFAMAAHRAGQSVSQISAQLCRNGYAVTTAEVTASLNKKGVVLNEVGP